MGDSVRLPTVVAVLLLLGAVGTGYVTAADSTISMTVADRPVTTGETIRVAENPTLGLSVETNAPIESVQVKVDGKLEETFSPEGTAFSTNTTLGMADGRHEVQVLAKADSVSTASVTVIKDTLGPRVAYTSPWQTGTYEAVPDPVTIPNGNVTLAGNLTDTTGVTSVRIERRYYYKSSSAGTSRTTHTIRDPGDSFSQHLLLGNGSNRLAITYTDEMGNVRQDALDVVVNDTTAPTIDVDVPEVSGVPTVDMTATIGDNVKIDRIAIEKPDGGTVIPVRETDAAPDEDRLSMTIERSLHLFEGKNTVTITATDVAGNVAEREYTIEYDPNHEPRISLEAGNRIGAGSVSVVGRVDRSYIKTVSLEAVDVGSGDVVDTVSVYDGDGTARVDLEESVSIGDGATRVRAIVVTAGGAQYEQSVLVGPRGANATSGDGETTTTATTAGGTDDGSRATDASGASGRSTDTGLPGFGPLGAVLALLLAAAGIARRS